ncbi:MAG: LmeA family phospholipid-binding protein [Trebonia sp.]
MSTDPDQPLLPPGAEPPTRAVPAWQLPPPPPPPGAPSQRRQPPGPPPPQQQPRLRRRRRKRRVRRSVMALFTVIVLLIILVIADRVALAVTENDMASQFQSNGFPVKPSVAVEGFPFLTQLVAKDFHTVNIDASNVPAGPVSITTVHAKIDGLHFTSLSSSASARADRVDATAFVSFGALAAAGGIGGGNGITVTPAGPNTVKISAGIGGVFSDSEKARITTTGPQTISVKVLPSGGPLGSLLSSFGSFSFTLPNGVPSSLRITNVDLNSQGLTISASATNASFGQ